MIDQTSTQGMTLRKAVGLLRGEPGSTVTLSILRGKQQPFDVTLTREIIRVESVKSRLEPDGIGYVRISHFGGDTADGFKKAIADLKRDANGRLGDSSSICATIRVGSSLRPSMSPGISSTADPWSASMADRRAKTRPSRLPRMETCCPARLSRS